MSEVTLEIQRDDDNEPVAVLRVGPSSVIRVKESEIVTFSLDTVVRQISVRRAVGAP